MKIKSVILSVVLGFAVLGALSCDAYPSYYGNGPYYTGYPGSVTIAIGDRPYYRGPGYWSRGSYYVWRAGHWRWHHGVRVWRPGHYVVRAY